MLGVFLGTLLADNTGTLAQVKSLQAKLLHIEKNLNSENNTWLKKFESFETYGKISLEIQRIQERLKTLQSKGGDNLEISALNHSLRTLKHQEKLLEPYKANPFKDLVEKPQIPSIPNITSPFAIMGGLSFIRTMRSKYANMQQHQKNLGALLSSLNQKLDLLDQLKALQPSNKQLSVQIYQERVKKIEFASAQNLLKASINAYAKDMEEAIQNIKTQIKDQIFKLLYVVLIALSSIVLAWVLKRLSHKYLYDDERAYTINKAINFINANVVVLIFLFAYLENVSYLVTMLGFVGAGFAIAMRDLFMSVLGWLTIILRGSLHVGDRVKVSKDGNTYVGDVLDISMLYTTIFEDVTLTTYLKNDGRAGRIVFVPNNYIFTGLFSNYSHLGMKTVWDSVDFFLTFDSNHQKAMDIAIEITNTYAQDYSQMARTQFNKMRTKYALRNVDASPKVFVMPEKEGMRLYVSYLANAYNTLPLRSTISLQIMQAFLKSRDIFVSPSLKKEIQEVQGVQENLESPIAPPPNSS